ncbi:hypothetical protein GCM10010124_30380 [Pilimelia terevasa]|uniref:Uncharacterized protein n=1 Tax=Pilimelia terevasa TaxID=53372 RepID=A0A8J3BVF8_9ACTN|nr:hypothetical protein [Pilimelia terevasa]GGK35589.1 hypothetical protein GCM10010124_30380 [Pilimelia terevasa]
MRNVLVTTPNDTQWTVRVVWEPRWRALARRFGGWRLRRRNRRQDAGHVVDGTGQLGDVALSGSRGSTAGSFDLGDALLVLVVVFIGVIAAAALFWWVLLPLLLLLIDLVVVLVLLVLALAGRVLFRRPWTVEARSGGETFTAQVVGWRAALCRRDEIAESLRRGLRPVDGPVTAP